VSVHWPERTRSSEAVRSDRIDGWLGLDDEVEDIFAPRPRKLLVLRRIDLWSVLKVSLVLYLSLFVVFLLVGVGLWVVARHAGAIGNLENLIGDLGLSTDVNYKFPEARILQMSALIGPILVVLGSLATVAGVALFNLVARLVGGVEVTVTDGEALPRV
jgi:hypothetical protein